MKVIVFLVLLLYLYITHLIVARLLEEKRNPSSIMRSEVTETNQHLLCIFLDNFFRYWVFIMVLVSDLICFVCPIFFLFQSKSLFG